MPTRSIQPRVIYANIVRDFEAAWNGIAASPRGDTGLGNFLFGFTGTLLLEWACRVCRQDAPGAHLDCLTRRMTLIARATTTKLLLGKAK
ncbi:MAG: hypothetical protein Q8P50_00345 [Bacillota bacterium]|nr:hypothetical protein [Bacillota bacterium]